MLRPFPAKSSPEMSGVRSIVFMTDFGLESEWVGICHAVMCKVAPESRVIDLSHFIEPLDVEAGARMLTDSLGVPPRRCRRPRGRRSERRQGP